MRHAKSAWPDGVADLERPLNDRGRRDAPAAGRWLRESGLVPDHVLCSPALRTRQTLALTGAEWETMPPVIEDDRLYGESLPGMLAAVRTAPPTARTVLLVGHNPDVTTLVVALAGEPVSFRTATLAVLDSTAGWAAADSGWGALRTAHTARG
ncbi:histidine phosphatase family protein [Amycolatopsis suaedae]|uniref:Histidine phosphatase family protein n=2 Tax=Amycolatopsis suaedae TaxID=2510978 RepID=A0A4Q7J275_9PSEU|nr:histidine phosphatase family protein [Amycolatopsis suaedae]